MTLDELNQKADKSLYIDTTTGVVKNPDPDPVDPNFAPNILLSTEEVNKLKTETMTAEEYDAQNPPANTRNTIVSVDGEGIGRAVINKSTMAPIDINTIAPHVENEDHSYTDKLFGELDAAVGRTKNEISELHADILDHQLESMIESEIGDEDSVSEGISDYRYETKDNDDDVDEEDNSPVAASARLIVPSENPLSIDDIDDNDIFTDIENEGGNDSIAPEDQDALVKKMVNDLGVVARDNIVPIKDKIDPSKFTISKKPMSISSILKNSVANPLHVADWVLYSTGRAITMSALSGPEIEKLNVNPRGVQNKLNIYRNAYMILYNHVIDANKPNFESWLKLVRFHDIDSLYFCAYMATFDGSNYITFNCPKDHHVFLKDLKFDDMVKYKDDAAKVTAKKILAKDTTSNTNEYSIELRQISDEYMVGIKAPSIFDVVIQNASLSEDFISKYADLIDTMSYIDQVYYIDRDNSSLVPVDIKADPNNQTKTASNRIRIYYEILKKITSDQFYELNSFIRKIDDANSVITYCVPEVTCPKCGTVIPEEERDASQILFTRHQLGAFANMPNT